MKNIQALSKDELVVLVEKIADALQGEDAGDICLYIAKLLDIDLSRGNEI